MPPWNALTAVWKKWSELPDPSDDDGPPAPMRRMIEEQLRARGVKDARVLAAIESVDRRLFLPEGLRERAFEDSALAIGHDQSISQPFIVAYMTELLELEPYHNVLEVGTGSGYQTAVLARLSKKVFTVERIAELSEAARTALAQAGIRNVELVHADGARGYRGGAPYDRILVTAAAEKVHEELVDQLANGGILVAPEHAVRENSEAGQKIRRWRREGSQIKVDDFLDVRFVPLVESPIDGIPQPET